MVNENMQYNSEPNIKFRVRNSDREHNKDNAKLYRNSISCFYVNARSIVNKLDELAL